MGYEIFERLCKEKGVKPAQVSKATGIATATLTSWKKGDYTPKQDKLQKIADYFGVALEYLMTGEPPKGVDKDYYLQLDERTRNFIQLYLNADPNVRDAVDLVLESSQQRS